MYADTGNQGKARGKVERIWAIHGSVRVVFTILQIYDAICHHCRKAKAKLIKYLKHRVLLTSCKHPLSTSFHDLWEREKVSYSSSQIPVNTWQNPLKLELLCCVKIRWKIWRNRSMPSYFCEIPQDFAWFFRRNTSCFCITVLQSSLLFSKELQSLRGKQ